MAEQPHDLASLFHLAAYTGVALLLLTKVGNMVCKLILDRTKLTAARDAQAAAVAARDAAPIPPAVAIIQPQVGSLIGSFERILIAVGLLAGSWELLLAVVALKTVARFKELDERLLAEYFLVGSLFSILWSLAIVGAWVAYDHAFGLDVFGQAILAR
jgi:hypothetical protein